MEQKTTYVANIDKLPLLQYMKNPVLQVGSLYTKYPLGGQFGWFVWVEEKKTFYYWDTDVNDWLQISNIKSGGIADGDDLENVTLNNIDVIREKTVSLYTPSEYSGLGKVILRKNLVSNVNTLTETMLNKSNTVYEIRYDFDLGGKTIIVAENCELKFLGGSFKNGNIEGNNTRIKADIYNIFNDCTLSGDFITQNIYSTWFNTLKTDLIDTIRTESLYLLDDITEEIYINKSITVTSFGDIIKIGESASININASNVIVKNLNIDSYSLSGPIRAERLSTTEPMENIVIDRVVVRNENIDAFNGIAYLGYIVNSQITNSIAYGFQSRLNQTQGFGFHTTWRRSPGLPPSRGNDINPVNVIIKGCSAYECAAGISASGGSGIIIEDCYVEDCFQGYFLNSGHYGNEDNIIPVSGIINNSVAKDCLSGINLTATDESIDIGDFIKVNYTASNNVLLRVGGGSNSRGIGVRGNFKGNINIKNNTVEGFINSISIGSSETIFDTLQGKINISNNSFTASNSSSIQNSLYLEELNIENNKFFNAASLGYMVNILKPSKTLSFYNNTFGNSTDTRISVKCINIGIESEDINLLQGSTLNIINNDFKSVLKQFNGAILENENKYTFKNIFGNTLKHSVLGTSDPTFSIGENKIFYSDNYEDIPNGGMASGDLLLRKSSKFIMGSVYRGGNTFKINTFWEANKKISEGTYFYHLQNVYLATNSGVLGAEPPAFAGISTQTNGEVNLRYVRKIYDPDANFDVHTDINYQDISSLPSDAPIGYKAYVISEKVLAVFNGVVWINSKSGHNILFKTEGTTAQRPTLSSDESGFVYYDTTVGKPIWWTGIKWVLSDGTDA